MVSTLSAAAVEGALAEYHAAISGKTISPNSITIFTNGQYILQTLLYSRNNSGWSLVKIGLVCIQFYSDKSPSHSRIKKNETAHDLAQKAIEKREVIPYLSDFTLQLEARVLMYPQIV